MRKPSSQKPQAENSDDGRFVFACPKRSVAVPETAYDSQFLAIAADQNRPNFCCINARIGAHSHLSERMAGEP
jgi:hypothetical protein